MVVKSATPCALASIFTGAGGEKSDAEFGRPIKRVESEFLFSTVT